jgi:hypothetical protein
MQRLIVEVRADMLDCLTHLKSPLHAPDQRPARSVIR